DPAVRANAVHAAPDPLRRHLAATDPSPIVRAAAARLRGERAAADPMLLVRAFLAEPAPAGAARSFVDVLVLSPDGEPLRDQPVDLVFSDGRVKPGRTDGSGSLHEEDAPAGPFLLLPR